MAHPDKDQLIPYLVIEIDGDVGKFRAYSQANQWAIMASAAADKSGSVADQMAANFQVATTSVLPSERDALNEFMIRHSFDGRDVSGPMWEGLSKLWAGETRLPLVQESTDSLDSTSETNFESTQPSSEPESEPPGTARQWYEKAPEGILIRSEEVGSSSPV
jgi:hypothetical protein